MSCITVLEINNNTFKKITKLMSLLNKIMLGIKIVCNTDVECRQLGTSACLDVFVYLHSY